MRGFISKFTLPSVVLSSVIIFGCSSSDGGGSSGATVPANAVVITEENAYQTVVAAIGLGIAVVDAVPPVGVDITPSPSYREIIEFVKDKARYPGGSSDISVSTPTGIDATYPCETGDITISSTDTDTSSSGTLTFNECVTAGMTITGTVNFNFTWTADEDYSESIQGNISVSVVEGSFSLNGLDLKETGNELTGDYSINTFTYSVDSSAGGGFLVQLLDAVIGVDDGSCPNSGIFLVTGANNTQAKASINSEGTLTVEFNDGSGSFTQVTTPPGNPYPCTDFFYSY